MYPLPSAPPQGGRIPATYSTSGKPTKRSRLTPGDPSPNRMNKRALTWSQADSSRRGGNPRSPRTSISAWVPRGPLSAFLSARGGSVCGPAARVPAREDPPLCPSSRGGGGVGPPPARAQRLCPPRGPGNPQMGRYHPRAGRGEGSPAPRLRGPRGGPRHARLPASSGRGRRRQGNPGGQASRRPATAPPPSPGRPMVRSAARTGASRSGSERARAPARAASSKCSGELRGWPVCGFFS